MSYYILFTTNFVFSFVDKIQKTLVENHVLHSIAIYCNLTLFGA